jgi:CRISPR/Cas system CSM-associated protein Csm5 (group 7 of RAMP superfamily)
MLKPEELFPLVNTHTLRILNDEIQYWEEKAGNPEALGNTVEEMQRIADIASACAANECVLRIGWGSGFRFMTGDWHGAMTDDDYERLLKSVRPRHSVDLIFPKSMRFVKGGMPMGFVKLTLQSQQ